MSGAKRPKEYEKLIVKGKRCDGRKIDELRPLTIKVGVIKRANGSAYVELGKTKVYAAVYGPKELHPRRLVEDDKAVLSVKYSMLAFSVNDRARPGPNRRSTEISKVVKHALEPVIFLEEFPQLNIELIVDIIQADAGTRTAAVIAGSVALANAGIPMKGLVSACAAGKVDGEILLDLNAPEDNFGDSDLPIAMTSTDKKITLMQLDGVMTKAEIQKAIILIRKGNDYIISKQIEALKGVYQ
ncbi:MAG: exosome complex exonuclease Rrp41 [DPANN group archaeon]|nr:exosome complex exonuclease Rrp41 [DPANN group archaeon]